MRFKATHPEYGDGYVNRVGSNIDGGLLIACSWYDSFCGVAGGWYLPGQVDIEDKGGFFKKHLLPRLERLASPQSF